jgi:hypothetical protein
VTGKRHYSNPILVEDSLGGLSHQRYTRRTQVYYNPIVQKLCACLGANPLKTVRPLDIHDFLTVTLWASPADMKFRSDFCVLGCFSDFSTSAARLTPWPHGSFRESCPAAEGQLCVNTAVKIGRSSLHHIGELRV